MPASKPSDTQIMPADDAAIGRAVAILREGRPVALPTETVYGLAADAARADAVAAIYRTKGRPDFNPLIVHVPDMDAARRLAFFDERAEKLGQAFWPGPLTLVLPLADDAPIAPAVTAGLPTIALRCPAHPVMRGVLTAGGMLLAAPSANRSGGISPTTAAHVAASLGDAVPLILDGGPCTAGLESTIVALRNFAGAAAGWQLLRPGPIDPAEIAALLGEAPLPLTDHAIEAPGQLASHYAPSKPVRLGAAQAGPDEWLIGFGEVQGDDTLSAAGDLAEAAANLYAALHRADASPRLRIAVAPVPGDGMGAAINDRLRRAAA
ncbi:MAG: threonylcarbamoyl-AMP synthase [Blastomonas fulva]|jgi:L-threonylcarbamoyladenylate synthase|uniref:L-threonylcarbamoyladenylate synthase n=1 Tax=Blastomonas fulva TaxID=1550728 RepID=UPI0024E1A2E5|nr:L-threonylcarbamoyladenylate synthase [Blastomonas fulva]MDK2757598.1 threonylcarbamoyl-AMP synthase [Blastomonas fulva]